MNEESVRDTADLTWKRMHRAFGRRDIVDMESHFRAFVEICTSHGAAMTRDETIEALRRVRKNHMLNSFRSQHIGTAIECVRSYPTDRL